MRGWTAALLLLAGAMVAEALPTDDQNDAVWTGEWRGRNVRKLYDTPFGAVYQLTPAAEFSFGVSANGHIADFPLSTLQFDLLERLGNRRRMARFVAARKIWAEEMTPEHALLPESWTTGISVKGS